MKKVKAKKEYFEYRVLLDEEQNNQLLEQKKLFGATITGTLRRALRLLVETELQKNQIIEYYHNGKKTSIVE
jgi:hypothetical protein